MDQYGSIWINMINMDQYGTIKFKRNPWGLWPSPMKDEMSPSHFGVSTESTKCSWFDRVGAVADRLLADVPTSPTTLGDISSPWRSTCNKDQQGLIHQPLLNTMLLLLSVLSDSATAVNWYLHLTQKLLVPLSFPLNNPIKPSSWLSLLVLHKVLYLQHIGTPPRLQSCLKANVYNCQKHQEGNPSSWQFHFRFGCEMISDVRWCVMPYIAVLQMHESINWRQSEMHVTCWHPIWHHRICLIMECSI